MTNRTNNRAKFCSRECNEAAQDARKRAAKLAARAAQACLNCQTSIPPEVSGRAKFCSRDCLTAWHNRQKAEAKTSALRARQGPCRRCGEKISETRQANAVYCSRACMVLDVRARNYDSDKARDYNRRYLYGIGSIEVDRMIEEQGGGCGICGTTDWPGKDNRPHVDHNHATGAPRGVLCGNCNQGLGMFGDDPARLRAAADYLDRAASRTLTS